MFKKKGITCFRLLAWMVALTLIAAGAIGMLGGEKAEAATWIRHDKTLTITAVDATILDGTSANRTYMATDRVADYSVKLDEFADAVEIHLYSTGDDTAGDTAKINIYGYSSRGPAIRIFEAVTFTLGTAVAPGSGLYADTISGTDLHSSTIGISDSGNNTVCRISFDKEKINWLYFEPETFTGITNVIIVVSQYGFKPY